MSIAVWAKRMRRLIIFALLITASANADEISSFWQDFPKDGFSNKLSSYGYDRNYARTATEAFVDQAVQDLATNTLKRRMAEYVCVMFYMDRTNVTARLGRLVRDASPAIQRAARSVKNEIQALDREKPKKPGA